MTIPTSTVPDAKAYLTTLLETNLTPDSDGSTFGVFYSTPPTANQPNDMVLISDVPQRQLTPFGLVGDMGPQAFTETYTLTVLIDCYRGGDQAQIVETRAWALETATETLIRTDPTFGGLLLRSAPDQTTSTTGWNEEMTGRRCQIPLTITCFAVL